MTSLVLKLEEIRAEIEDSSRETQEAKRHLEASIWWLAQVEPEGVHDETHSRLGISDALWAFRKIKDRLA